MASEFVQELSVSDPLAELSKHPVSILDIYAPWCGTCRLLAPQYEQVAAENSQFKFFKIDGEKYSDFSSTLPVDNLPYIAVFHKGEFVGGKTLSKKEALVEMLQVISQQIESGK